MSSEELNFVGGNPGAVRYGNFINYYSFHNVEERVNILNQNMFPTSKDKLYICLDIGCNTGELTYALYNYLKTLYPNYKILILAVDIDPNLIQRAKEAYGSSKITFIALNIMSKDGQSCLREYLNSQNKKEFDITFCFSITMWIHLNNGDDGLKEFLTFTKNIARSIVIEPQPWICYRSAQRRVKKSGNTVFPFYEKLRIRSSVGEFIEKVLSEENFMKVYETPKTKWNRKIQCFQKDLS